MLALIAVALSLYGYDKYTQHKAAAVTVNAPSTVSQPNTPASSFRCDGRNQCSQMTSCAEAKFFLNHCPNPEMDGNHDGTPCEQQWCTHPFAE